MAKAMISAMKGRAGLRTRSCTATLKLGMLYRPFSQVLYRRSASENAEKFENNDLIQENRDNGTSQLPWYMRGDVASQIAERETAKLPEIPAEAPASVRIFLDLIAKEYGLTDIQLFDMTGSNSEEDIFSTQRFADYIIMCTGKSEKHNFKAASELRYYIKHNFDVIPVIEGMVSNHRSPVERRRLAKRARKGQLATDNDYGKAPNNWIMCDTSVDNIFIHIMTESRRKEMDLESIWLGEDVEDEKKPQDYISESQVSDNIFSTIRRGYHTVSPFRSQVRSHSTSHASILNHVSIMNDLGNESSTISDRKVKQYVDRINSIITGDLESYNNKIDLLSVTSLLSPTTVSFDDVLSCIYQKYGSLAVALDSKSKLQEERMKDTVKVLRLLIDASQSKHTEAGKEKAYIDEQYSKLSSFIAALFAPSGHQIEPLSHPHFFPLLWRLSYLTNDAKVITQKDIDGFICSDSPIPTFASRPSILQAGNRSRDVLDLIEYSYRKNNYLMSPSFGELVLITYGNAGKWTKFWKQWESFTSHFQDTKTKRANLTDKWVRLSVYIAMRNDRAAMLHFLNHYWHISNSVALSFTEDYIASDYNFSSEKERSAFKKSMTIILNAVRDETGPTLYPKIQQFVDKMD